MIEFAVAVALVALAVKFLRTLAEKWGILEWLQVHAPNEFLHKLFTCSFCQSFWLGLAICIVLVVFGAPLYWLSIPIFSCNLR